MKKIDEKLNTLVARIAKLDSLSSASAAGGGGGGSSNSSTPFVMIPWNSCYIEVKGFVEYDSGVGSLEEEGVGLSPQV